MRLGHVNLTERLCCATMKAPIELLHCPPRVSSGGEIGGRPDGATVTSIAGRRLDRPGPGGAWFRLCEAQ